MSSNFPWTSSVQPEQQAPDEGTRHTMTDRELYGFDGFGPQRAVAPARPRPQSKGLLGGLLAVLLLVASKLQWLLLLLKFSKLGVTTISMLVSAVVYGLIFGWAYGIGFVLLIFVHEMGHVWAAKLEGVKVSAPMFIPFMGALISMQQRPGDSLAEAKIAAGGPILGSLGALGCLGLYSWLHQPLFLALAYIGFFLNLFNLVPITPLDGGRILGAASKWALLAGLPILAIFAIRSFNPFLFYFLILGALDLLGRFRNPDVTYYKLAPATRWAIAGFYVVLAASVAWGMAESHTMLQGVRAVRGLS